MSNESNSLESDLRDLRASGIDPLLLDRLDSCADGTWTELSPTELQWEHQLRRHAPVALSAGLMASLESLTADLDAPSAAQVIRFPNTTESPRRSRFGWRTAAAAAAVIGAFGALLVPTGNSPAVASNSAGETSAPARIPSHVSSSQLTPAGFSRDLSEASDQGVVWQSSHHPHRVVKVVYKDKVTLKHDDGTTYEVEQPRVEYYLVPTKPE